MRRSLSFLNLLSKLTCLLTLGLQATTLLAIQMESGHSYVISAPISLVGGELGLRAETNLWNSAGLGLELMLSPLRDDCTKKEHTENGCSMLTSASEASLSFARYSLPMTMSGMFWSASAGYRRSTFAWKRASQATMLARGYASGEFQESELEDSLLSASGPAYRIRAGYRYAAESIPMVSGLYGGLKHFDGTYRDVKEADKFHVLTTAEEKKSIRHRMMTSLEIGLEFGMAF